MVDKANAWKEFKCPVCGSQNFSEDNYELADLKGILDASRGRVGKSFEIRALTCRECGFIVLKKR